MSYGILQVVVFLVLLGLIAKPLGTYMVHVYKGERTFLHPVLRPAERAIYRVCGVDERREMGVVSYTVALLVFNFVVLLFIYAVLRLQGHLPLNLGAEEDTTAVPRISSCECAPPGLGRMT